MLGTLAEGLKCPVQPPSLVEGGVLHTRLYVAVYVRYRWPVPVLW